MASTPSSVSALLKPRANLGRNQFPLDHKQVFSIKAGQITPVKCMHFIPDDYFDISTSEFCITFPMNTAPFLRGRKETVLYSVYYSAVWSLFNQYIGQRQDPKTSAFGSSPKLVEPRIAKFELYKYAFLQFWGYMYYKWYLRAYYKSLHPEYSDELFESFLIRHQNGWLTASTYNNHAEPLADGFGLLSTDRLPQFTWDVYEYNQPSMVSVSPEHWFCDVVGHFRCYNVIRKLDMLGYGNLYPWFKECDSAIGKIYNDITDWSSDNNPLSVFLQYSNDVFKLLSLRLISITCTYDHEDQTTGFPQSGSNIQFEYVNLYPICAYNLIFYHFFRNSFYDLNYDPRNYNLDFVSTVSQNVQNLVSISDFSLRFLDIEYHQWKKDTFTSVIPDTQFGAVASIDMSVVSDSDISRWSSSTGTAITDVTFPTGTSTSRNLKVSNADISHTHEVQSSFDVISLKRAEMLQDYRQTLMRAGNKTSDIFTALYGGAPSSEHEDDIIPRFLDTFGEDVFIDPVTATANTEQGENGTLGDLSSRGKFSGQSGHVKFNAGKNFGCILMLTYFVPTAEYNSYVLDKHVCELSPEEHYISNFENYGLEPIYSNELNDLQRNNDISVRGYGPRYHHKKSQVDMVHGAFCSLPNGLRVQRDISSVFGRGRDSFITGFFGEFNVWVAPRTDLQSRLYTQLRDFYINPSVLDNIFKFACSPDQDTDQVVCNVYINWQSTRAMSKVGLINFV